MIHFKRLSSCTFFINSGRLAKDSLSYVKSLLSDMWSISKNCTAYQNKGMNFCLVQSIVTESENLNRKINVISEGTKQGVRKGRNGWGYSLLHSDKNNFSSHEHTEEQRLIFCLHSQIIHRFF